MEQEGAIPVLPKENVCAPSWLPNTAGLTHSLPLNPAKPRDSSSACLVGIRDGQGMQGQQERAESTEMVQGSQRFHQQHLQRGFGELPPATRSTGSLYSQVTRQTMSWDPNIHFW